MATAEKLEQDEKPAPKPSVAAQNQESYNLLGQMMAGVQGGPKIKTPRKTR